MRITYVGPHDEVIVPALGDLVVKQGESVEVPDDAGHAMCEQDGWDTKASRKTAPKEETKNDGGDK